VARFCLKVKHIVDTVSGKRKCHPLNTELLRVKKR
jgi:hypothetical protein